MPLYYASNEMADIPRDIFVVKTGTIMQQRETEKETEDGIIIKITISSLKIHNISHSSPEFLESSE